MSLGPDCFHGKRLGAIAIAQGRDDSTLEQVMIVTLKKNYMYSRIFRMFSEGN